MPQNWLSLPSYKEQRKSLLKEMTWLNLARLGAGAFDAIGGEVVNVVLFTISNRSPSLGNMFTGVDASVSRSASIKAIEITESSLLIVDQGSQLRNPDARVSLEPTEASDLLEKYAAAYQGIKTGDDPRFRRFFWEVGSIRAGWKTIQGTTEKSQLFGGMQGIVRWENEGRDLARLQGLAAWGKPGIAVSLMSDIRVALFSADTFDSNVAVITPKNSEHIAAVWSMCSTPEYPLAVKKLESGIKANSATASKVPFDINRWRKTAEVEYPNGLPLPYSDDPTQWIFHGHPLLTVEPLHVAVARLVGYVWPAESNDKLELSDEAREWIARSKALVAHADKGGIVCLPPVGREKAAADRLLNLLAAAYGPAWSNDVLAQLLKAADHAGKSLETWLRDKFFTQHCTLFGNRPFVWHIWDGLRDGFAALVNYHKLDYKTLEALIYTYLGDWISRQRRDADN